LNFENDIRDAFFAAKADDALIRDLLQRPGLRYAVIAVVPSSPDPHVPGVIMPADGALTDGQSDVAIRLPEDVAGQLAELVSAFGHQS
jgi:hypothetical protein